MSLFVAVKPSFNKEPQDVVALLGKKVVFQCSVDGEPDPNVLWRREDGKMPIGRARIADDKSLIIENVQPSDEGIYICTAENLVGTITAKASLVVNCEFPNFVYGEIIIVCAFPRDCCYLHKSHFELVTLRPI